MTRDSATPIIPPPHVLAAWGWSDAQVAPLQGGLINQTFTVVRGPQATPTAVLQRMHPIFAPHANEDIAAWTEHVRAQGLTAPKLLPTTTGDLWLVDGTHTWRALSWLPGQTLHRIAEPAVARTAGMLVAQMHRALDSFVHEYRFARAGVHDTARHLARLKHTLAQPVDTSAGGTSTGGTSTGGTSAGGTSTGGAWMSRAQALGAEIVAAAAGLPAIEVLTPRHCHGDLKISNLLFASTPTGLAAAAIVDFDTIGLMPLAHELGDAMRSWCNPHGEDDAQSHFRADVFAAAMDGYREVYPLSPGALRSIVAGVQTICTELAARFCQDVFDDSYFGWDASRFPSRREHNLLRARRQLDLAASVAAQRPQLAAALGV